MPEGGRLVLSTATVLTSPAEFGEPGSERPYAVLAVSDNGTGMDAATQAQNDIPHPASGERRTRLGASSLADSAAAVLGSRVRVVSV